MADKKPDEELEDYAGGWITERKGTNIPKFLILCYVVIAGGVFAYFLLYTNGDVSSGTPRAALVRQFDSFTTPANGFMYFVAALVAIYAIITVLFALRKAH